MTVPVLSTDRLTLRAMSMEDWESYCAAWADPEMTRFIGGKPRTRQESWVKFAQGAGLWPLLGYGYWSFIERETGRFVGNGGFAQFERGIAELEGYPEAGWAFSPAAWGKGYATEAIRAALGWADANLAADEVRCIIDPDNIASQRVAAKLGFTKFATVDDPIGRVHCYRRPKGG